MKVAIITNVFPAISETFILSEITDFIDSNYDVTIISTIQGNLKKTHSDFSKYKLIKKSYYINKPNKLLPSLISAFLLLLKNREKITINLLRSLNFFKYGRLALQLKLLFFYLTLPKKNFDIVHCHFGPNGLYGVFLKNIKQAKEVFVTFHGYDATRKDTLAENEYYKYLFKSDCRLISNTQFLKNQLLKYGAPNGKISILPACLQLNRYKYTTRVLDLKDKINILTVARLVEKKGHIYSIKAISSLIKKYRNIQYHIVGDGELKHKLQNLVIELGINNYVIFHNDLTQNETKNLLYKSHIFLLSSVKNEQNEEEAQGLVLVEAQAVGLPIVCTNIGGIPETIYSNPSAFMVESKNSSEIEKKIEYVINNYSEITKKTVIARKRMEKAYDCSIIYGKLKKIFYTTPNQTS